MASPTKSYINRFFIGQNIKLTDEELNFVFDKMTEKGADILGIIDLLCTFKQPKSNSIDVASFSKIINKQNENMIKLINNKTGQVIKCKSIYEAALILGKGKEASGNIAQALNGKRKSAYGFTVKKG